MRFRKRPATKPVYRPASKHTKFPAQRRPAPPAPPAEQSEEDFFDPDTPQEDAFDAENESEQEPEQEPAPRRAQRWAANRRAPARTPRRAPVSDHDQSGLHPTDPTKIRLSGLWESRKWRGLFNGNLKDVQAVIDWLTDMVQAGQKVSLVMYQNDVNGQNDPAFTVYLREDNYVPGQGRGRGGYGRRNYNRGGGDNRDQF